MDNHKRIYLGYVVLVSLTVILLITAACSQQLSGSSTTAQITSTPVPPKATPTSRPYPEVDEWDLLIISDSSNWGVGQYYAKLIEADLNVKVTLHDCWVGTMSIGLAVKALQAGKSLEPALGYPACQSPWSDQAWSDLIKNAEVMVIFGNWGDSPSDGPWRRPDNFTSCMTGAYKGWSITPGFDAYKEKLLNSCTPENLAAYKIDLSTLIDTIYTLREGRPLILRFTDLYIPVHATYKEYGVDEVCSECLGNVAKVFKEVAEEYGIPIADTMAGFNGPDHMAEMGKEYIQSDGQHLTSEGAKYVATLLQQTGYAYAGK